MKKRRVEKSKCLPLLFFLYMAKNNKFLTAPADFVSRRSLPKHDINTIATARRAISKGTII